MKSKKGFTLIELLVVISIIALLLSILMPALSKVKEQARILVCKTNLHQWGIAIMTYTSDNDGSSLSSTTYAPATYGSFSILFPNEMFLDSVASAAIGTGPWTTDLSEKEASVLMSQEAIAPYAPGINEKSLRKADLDALGINSADSPGAEDFDLRGMWKCPANNFSLLDHNLRYRLSTSRAYFSTDYSYFGRGDLFADSVFASANGNERKNFPGKDMNGKQLIMSDKQYWYSSYGEAGFFFNHGKLGASNPDGLVDQPIKTMTGTNKLFGDGAVTWKKKSEFDPDLFDLGSRSTIANVDPYINTGITGIYIFY